jgi:hypothetical protein
MKKKWQSQRWYYQYLDLLNTDKDNINMVGQNNRTPTSTYAANYSIVTETGNNNSATIEQTRDKHVSEVTQDGLNYGFGGYKNRSMLIIW